MTRTDDALAYHAPDTVDAARRRLAETPGARVIAGGQTLMLLVRQGLVDADALVDIENVPALSGIAVGSGTATVGATTTYADLLAADLTDRVGALGDACAVVGDRQVRNAGTLGGAVCHADPALDVLAPLLCLDAELSLGSVDGERTVPLPEFLVGHMRTALDPAELVESIRFDVPSASGATGRVSAGSAYEKHARVADGWATVGVAALVSVADGAFETVRIGLTAVAGARGRARADRRAGHQGSGRGGERTGHRRDGPARRPLGVGRVQGRARADARRAESRDRGRASGGVAVRLSFDLDGESVTVDVPPERPLRDVVREECGETSVKAGCDSGRCGVCTVHLAGEAVKSCLVPAAKADGASVTTVAGIEEGTTGRALQDAFEAEFALQCGYCTPGMVMTALDYLEDESGGDGDGSNDGEGGSNADREAIRAALSGTACRCTGYEKIVDAVEAVATGDDGD
mgnify:CR=1 FL=1